MIFMSTSILQARMTFKKQPSPKRNPNIGMRLVSICFLKHMSTLALTISL